MDTDTGLSMDTELFICIRIRVPGGFGVPASNTSKGVFYWVPLSPVSICFFFPSSKPGISLFPCLHGYIAGATNPLFDPTFSPQSETGSNYNYNFTFYTPKEVSTVRKDN